MSSTATRLGACASVSLVLVLLLGVPLVSGGARTSLPIAATGAANAHYFAGKPTAAVVSSSGDVHASSAASSTNKSAPVWPFQWNATQAKINPFNSHIWWTKFYYDWPNGWTRTDFMNGYYNTENQWSLNCSILFANNQVWMIFPDEQACFLDHDNLGTISPWWLQSGVYQGSTNFRGLYADKWTLTELGIDYYARTDSIYTPLRSTNQAEDPGATDYLDVVLGPQNPDLFKLPAYCKKATTSGCPPDWP